MLISLLIGAIIGALGGWFMNVRFASSTIINILLCVVVGLVGSVIGGAIGRALKVKNTILQFILDVVGACILIFVLKLLF